MGQLYLFGQIGMTPGLSVQGVKFIRSPVTEDRLRSAFAETLEGRRVAVAYRHGIECEDAVAVYSFAKSMGADAIIFTAEDEALDYIRKNPQDIVVVSERTRGLYDFIDQVRGAD